jgi:tetratricopeptide (TPR) repeat protein
MAAPITPQPAPIAVPPPIVTGATSALPRLIVAGVALLGGLLLIALAIPRLGAALELARAKPVYDRLQSHDASIDDATLEMAIDALRKGFERSSEPQLGSMLASLYKAQADRTADAALATRRYAQAAEAARATLRISPSNLTAWVLLAASLDALNPQDPAVVAALTRAIRVGPYDPRLRDLRIMLAMRHWRRLDPETRALAAFLIKRAAQLDLRALAVQAREYLGLPAVHESLQDDPALRARFNTMYQSLPR